MNHLNYTDVIISENRLLHLVKIFKGVQRTSFHDVRLVIKKGKLSMRIGSFFYLNEAKALLLNGTAPRGS